MTPDPEDGAAPLSAEEGIALLDGLLAIGGRDTVAVAVSGGPDSTALLHVADLWSRRRSTPLLILTVDHGLRAEAAAEAAAVQALARRLGHSHRTLRWTGPKPATGLQAAARAARLRLMAEACHAAGADTLLLAHHRDDQAETVLHRIDRATGPAGLAGMASTAAWHGIHLARPFLGIAKRRLIATCRAAGMGYAEDPSNADLRYTRGQFRRLRPALDEVGLTVDRLTRLADAMGVARAALETAARDLLERDATILPCGTVRLDRAAFAAGPPALTATLLTAVLRISGGGGYPAGTGALATLRDWLARSRANGRRTLAGCLVQAEADRVTVMREVAACEPARTVHPDGAACWDGRFIVRNATDRPVRVSACGVEGWRRIRRLCLDAAMRPAERDLPHAARLAWPIVADLDGVVALPHLVLSERRAPGRHDIGVEIYPLATSARRIDRPLAKGRLKT